MKTTKRQFTFCIVLLAVVVVGAILCILANRYLISHVEIADVSDYAQNQAAAETSSESGSKSISVAAADTAFAASSSTQQVTSDDWNYQNSAVSVSIKEVQTGNGSDKVTYFVADVVVNDATLLQSAFAQDQFGTNIIEYTSQIAADNNAIFAINGDYYGFRTDGIEIRNGVIYRDNPARIGLAFYTDGTMKIYDETQTSAQELLDEGVWNTLSFGPALIQDSVMVTDFSNANVDHNLGNHSIIGSNPRTGVGVISANHFVFVVVDGRSKGYSRGVSLEEFAQIFTDLGCTDAYNIDGGGSSTMYFMGRVVNNPLGQERERGTSDILYIGS